MADSNDLNNDDGPDVSPDAGKLIPAPAVQATQMTISPQQRAEAAQAKAEIGELWDSMDENFESFEFRVSRLALGQPLTPEVANNLPGYKGGCILDNTSREVLSSEIIPPWMLERGVPAAELKPVHCMPVVAVMKLPHEYISWKGRQERVAGEPPFHWKTLDKGDPRVKAGVWAKHGGTWGTLPEHRDPKTGKGIKPPVTINTNVLFLPVNIHDGSVLGGNPVIGSFSRTSAACGEAVATIMHTIKMEQLPPWGRIIWLYTAREQNADGVFYTFQATRGAKLSAFPFAGLFESMALTMARLCADKDTGKQFQQNILNMAQMAEAETHEAAGGSADTVDSLGTDDPFAGAAAGGAKGEDKAF